MKIIVFVCRMSGLAARYKKKPSRTNVLLMFDIIYNLNRDNIVHMSGALTIWNIGYQGQDQYRYIKKHVHSENRTAIVKPVRQLYVSNIFKFSVYIITLLNNVLLCYIIVWPTNLPIHFAPSYGHHLAIH